MRWKAQSNMQMFSALKAADESGTVDLAALTAEWRDTGKLSDKTYDQLKQKGFSPELVDRYVSDQEALAREVTRELAKIAGGVEGLDTVLAWAETGLSQQDKLAYNNAIDSANLPGAQLALHRIVAAYAEAHSWEPRPWLPPDQHG